VPPVYAVNMDTVTNVSFGQYQGGAVKLQLDVAGSNGSESLYLSQADAEIIKAWLDANTYPHNPTPKPVEWA